MNEHPFFFCTPQTNIICKSTLLQFFLNWTFFLDTIWTFRGLGSRKIQDLHNTKYFFHFQRQTPAFFPTFFPLTKLLCVCLCSVTQSMSDSYSLMDYSPPGSSIHGILQAKILVRVAISSSKASCWPRDQTRVSCISYTGRQILYRCCCCC